ncbi:uncharacterized protein LOC130370156 [Gadus chalcogrammus]|uniref:uncharacterized protein LOC130370156 n=1 Tax=Gadus chalcogrammus TaxID=1042646 RepID=UPI0024C48A4E|nr:uncharacterized protein LOC130370156 [Gadus chalcogrammus]
MMSSTAAGSTTSTPMMSSIAAGSTTSTPMMSSTSAGATVSTVATPAETTASTIATSAVATSTAASTKTPVEALLTAISSEGCTETLLCAQEPASCDPSVTTCYFVSAQQTEGLNYGFSLSGESEGYIAVALSTDSSLGGGDITYICANNEESFEFIGASLNNSALIRQTVTVNSVKGLINGTTIQCTFTATIPDATTRAVSTSYSLAILTGNLSSTGVLGNPVARVQTQVLDISDASSSTSILTTVATTTVATSTVANSGRPTHLALSQALLIILGTMGLALL